MKILYLFLDVDGVLNDTSYWEKFKKKNPELSDLKIPYIPFNPRSLRNLKKLKDELRRKNIKMEIVLNSSWKDYYVNQYVLKIRLIDYGIKFENERPDKIYGNIDKERDVKEFLKTKVNTNKYIVIDDSNLNFEEKHFVKTDMKSGFTNKKMYEALKKARKLWKIK